MHILQKLKYKKNIMSTCKTITISTCQMIQHGCNVKEIIKSQCIKYTGDDLAALGIDKGDTFKSNINF